MSGRAAKSERRAIRKAFGMPAVALVSAHEEGLKAHGDILRAVIFASFWGRVKWLLFGVRQHGT